MTQDDFEGMSALLDIGRLLQGKQELSDREVEGKETIKIQLETQEK